jgi:S-adenosylmethionine synthetase
MPYLFTSESVSEGHPDCLVLKEVDYKVTKHGRIKRNFQKLQALTKVQ